MQEERDFSESKPTTHRSAHNSFVVLPPSEGPSKSVYSARIQVGNADEVEERQRREEIESFCQLQANLGRHPRKHLDIR